MESESRLFSLDTSKITGYIEKNKMSHFLKLVQEFNQICIFWNANNLLIIISHEWKLYTNIIQRSKEEKSEVCDFFKNITWKDLVWKDILKTDM